MMKNIPIKFKAAILQEIGKPLVVDEISFKGPLLAGQILVKLFYSGICGKQLEEIDGKGGHDPWIPHLLGHEGTAEVIEAGPGVTKVKRGDTVVLHWMKGSGIQSEKPMYYRNKSIVNAGWVTTFNEYAVVSENRVTQISADSDMLVSALFGCAITTGVGVIINEANIRPHDIVLIYGCGGVGLSAVQAANLLRPKHIITVDVNDMALDMANKFGATVTINADKQDVISRVHELTSGKGATKVIITTGNPKAIESALDCAAVPSDCFLVGVPPKGVKIKVDAFSIMHKRNLRGSLGGDILPERDIPGYILLNNKGHLKANQLISKVLPFQEINKGIDLARSDNPGRVVIKF